MAVDDVVYEMKQKLLLRNSDSRLLDRYYKGNPPMTWSTHKADSTYARLLAQARSNFALLIIDSVNDRLKVEGFRLDDATADDFVWTQIWQANNLDIFAPMTHQQALVTGLSYVSVWPDEKVTARVRGESCMEVFHEVDPADPLTVVRAIKIWPDVLRKMWFCRLFEQDKVTFMSYPMQSTPLPAEVPGLDQAPALWNVDSETENPFGDVVPIVPFLNRPQLDGGGMSEIGDMLDVLDRINTLTADMLLVAELAAFRIRWATGLDIPVDATGARVEPFNVALDRLWVSESPETSFGSFDPTPLDGYGAAVDQAIQQAAAISRTPPFLLLGKITNLSAEALQGTTQGLVEKIKNRMLTYGQSWETVVKLALMAWNDPRQNLVDVETIWADPSSVSEAAKVDALTKMVAIGLPVRAAWERWGASPQEIARWEQQRADELWDKMLAAQAAQPPAVTMVNPAGGQTDQQQQQDQQQPDQQAQPAQ